MTSGGKREGAGRHLAHKSHGIRVNVYLPEYQVNYLKGKNMSAKIQRAVQSEIEQQARDRINAMGFTQQQLDFIFADWPEGDEHFAWLLTASRDEIINWGETGEWGATETE